ncbi:hypothetical protein G6F46_015462 [Rhizopus delemar]|nr:hypothetical protein G6F46_015462 [Rhizopus delemar]
MAFASRRFIAYSLSIDKQLRIRYEDDQRPQPAPGAIQRRRGALQQLAGHRAMGGGRRFQGLADSGLGQALLRCGNGGDQPGLLRRNHRNARGSRVGRQRTHHAHLRPVAGRASGLRRNGRQLRA